MSEHQVFDRILVGVDGTDYGFEALLQALALARTEAAVRAVTALDLTGVVQTGWDAPKFGEMLRHEAELIQAKAQEILAGRPESAVSLVRGRPLAVLRREIGTFAPTLLALGGRGRSRFLGALLGETASTLLHDATCSVLLARPHWGERWRPARVLVGVDGSEWSLAALRVADELHDRLGSSVTVVAARGGKTIPTDGPWADRVQEWDSASAVEALWRRSVSTDLVIVGSRGLHGIRALGSVSERVAHRVDCSVLVVRTGEQGVESRDPVGSGGR